jgi:hypothetical protein
MQQHPCQTETPWKSSRSTELQRSVVLHLLPNCSVPFVTNHYIVPNNTDSGQAGRSPGAAAGLCRPSEQRARALLSTTTQLLTDFLERT